MTYTLEQAIARNRRYHQLRMRIGRVRRAYFDACDRGRQEQHERIVQRIQQEIKDLNMQRGA